MKQERGKDSLEDAKPPHRSRGKFRKEAKTAGWGICKRNPSQCPISSGKGFEANDWGFTWKYRVEPVVDPGKL
jgi:hypothetical protein